MSIANKINGVYRDSIESSSKVNGVWRSNVEGYAKVNGVWRSTLQQTKFDPDDIIGFKLIYTRNVTRTHPNVSQLKFNPNIPYVFKLTGDNLGNMDLTMKGVVFEYSNELPEEAGVVMYEGRLFAMTSTGEFVNVCQINKHLQSSNNSNDGVVSHRDLTVQEVDSMQLAELTNTTIDKLDAIEEGVEGTEVPETIVNIGEVSEYANIYEAGVIHDADIKLYGYVLFEDYGYYFEGWNNIFNTQPFIDKTIYPDKTLYRKRLELNGYNLHPIGLRDNYFDSVATIGVARDMETSIYNMVGSYGVLDHTISRITLNGKDMPFVIEIK